MSHDRFPPLKSQEEIDREWPDGWWIVPAIVLGLAFWAAIIWIVAL